MSTTTTTSPQLTSTTAPGKVFSSRQELAEHYKSDWHKYNLKRRQADLPVLDESDFQARLEAALQLKQERETKQERTGKDHLKHHEKNQKKKKKNTRRRDGIFTVKSQAAAYDRIKEVQHQTDEDEIMVQNDDDDDDKQEDVAASSQQHQHQQQQEESPVIDPRQCLFDRHMSASIDANLERMQRKYGFFLPDQEYLVDAEGLLGYCHEKIKLGHYCLYCQRIFSTYQGCMKHMIAKNHTKLRYERGIDLDEFDPFYDFSEADKEFLSSIKAMKVDSDEDVEEAGAEETSDVDDEEDGWEDISEDDDAMDDEDERGEQDDDDLYAGYEDEIAKYGFDVTPLGELVFPDGRIIGHRGLARYYRQRHAPSRDRAAVVAARQAAGERLYRGRVYNVQQQQQSRSSALALSRAGISPGTASGRAGQGVLVSSGSGGFTSLSLYRFRAVTRKARRDEARGQRLQHRATMNMNKMDKKGNRLMNGVVVQKALR